VQQAAMVRAEPTSTRIAAI